MSTANRIGLARQAAYRVVNTLSMFDRFAVVTFDSDSYYLCTRSPICQFESELICFVLRWRHISPPSDRGE